MPSSSAAEPGSLVRLRPALGTLVRIAARGADAGTAIEAGFAAIERVGQSMSFHRADSELQRLMQAPAGDSVAVSADLWRVLAMAQRLWRDSDGLFDPAIAPALVDAGLLPPPAAPRPAAGASLADLELPAPGRARLRQPLWLDLGGIAKGDAVDQALAALRAAGATAGCVNAGGDLACFGDAETVGLRDPRAPQTLCYAFELRDAAAATSGAYFQPGALRGRRGRATRRRLGSVTVLAADCLTADALTKLVWALPSRATALLPAYGARALNLDARGRARWLAP